MHTPSVQLGTLACLVGGASWVLLGPPAVMQRHDLLSYDNYNRLLAVPLLLFLVGFIAARQLLRPRDPLGTAGFALATIGLFLLLVGNVVEFWGVLLQSQPNAQRAAEIGTDEHWIGSDIGWMIFGLGMFALLIGGILTALSIRHNPAFPRWVTWFMGLLGPGVLAGNLFAGAPFFLSIPVLAIYGLGWMALGRFVWQRAARAPERPGLVVS